MSNNIYFRKAIHTEHGAIFETQPLSKKEQEFNNYINTTYTDQAIEVGKDFKQRLYDKLNKVVDDSYYGVAVVSVLHETKRYIYIKNCDVSGNSCNSSDIEIDLLNHTYSELEHKD